MDGNRTEELLMNPTDHASISSHGLCRSLHVGNHHQRASHIFCRHSERRPLGRRKLTRHIRMADDPVDTAVLPGTHTRIHEP